MKLSGPGGRYPRRRLHVAPHARTTLCATVLMAAALVIAACGDSSSTGSGRAAASIRHGADASTRAAAVTTGSITHRPLFGTGGAKHNGDNPGRADSGRGAVGGQRNPCELVSKAEAQVIIGAPIAPPQEAPLGPTCIYQPLGPKGSVTLAIEAIDFARLKPQIRKTVRLMVAGHTAFCGDYGRPTVFVPLPGGRVLNVTAPCAVGARFGAKALSRLKA
jgi:hypothetical protein